MRSTNFLSGLPSQNLPLSNVVITLITAFTLNNLSGLEDKSRHCSVFTSFWPTCNVHVQSGATVSMNECPAVRINGGMMYNLYSAKCVACTRVVFQSAGSSLHWVGANTGLWTGPWTGLWTGFWTGFWTNIKLQAVKCLALSPGLSYLCLLHKNDQKK